MAGRIKTVVDEREFLQLTQNHRDFKRRLQKLNIYARFTVYDERVEGISKAWFVLAKQHLREARAARKARLIRTTYSRAYYAAYSASKAVRYLSSGFVSLHGDDHKKVGDLPSNFPKLSSWGVDLGILYEHRLRADYDNWAGTSSQNRLSLEDAVGKARRFIQDCQRFVKQEHGVKM